ncbi:MAG: hypothetical protein V4734_06080, partial [Terriglobus sp.]
MAYRMTSASTDTTQQAVASSALPDTPQNAWANLLARSQVTNHDGGGKSPVVSFHSGTQTQADAPDMEVQSMARILMLALTGFLTAGWFLSRALSPWMFMYGGMIVALSNTAATRGVAVTKDEPSSLVKWSIVTALALLALVYLTLKLRAKLGQ